MTLPRRTARDVLGDARNAATSIFQRIWLCEIKNKHREKMDSHGHCIRCGHPV